MVSEEGTRAEMGDEDDDLLRAAEELGIDLSGVRAGDGGAAEEPAGDAGEAADEQEEEIAGRGRASISEDPAAGDEEDIEDPVDVVADGDTPDEE